MHPNKLSSEAYLELPPVLADYLQGERNPWLEAVPNKGKVSLLDRAGVFTDLEALAVERRQLVRSMGTGRARAVCFSIGFEQGRRDAAHHYSLFAQDARVALQAGPVFAQLRGCFRVEPVRFEFDLDRPTLHGELLLWACAEALSHRMAVGGPGQCACWTTAGYLSGHISEILGRRVFALEATCAADGASACRFIFRLDAEWGGDAAWAREALRMETVEEELARKDRLLAAAHKAARRAQRALSDLNRRLQTDLMLENLVGESEPMIGVIKLARHVMSSDVPVLLVGEPGVGKETLARAIHYGGVRKSGPFVPVDCTRLSDTQLAQHLFGFTKGAFPGAVMGQEGAYTRAHGGTLYVSEVTRFGFETQGLLLQAMQEGRVQALGSDEPELADVRVIAATEFEPLEKKAEHVLREDFLYAIAVARVDVPPLRERGTDILRLANSFLRQYCERYGRPACSLSPDVEQALLDCAWPGNVRQLRNAIEHAVAMAQGQEVGIAHLPEEILATRWRRPPKDLSPEVVRAALRRAGGNRSRAAELLGVSRTTLWRVMKRLRIS